jgi:hypothetical protein
MIFYGSTLATLAIVIIDAMVDHAGLEKVDLKRKFLSFEADAALVF